MAAALTMIPSTNDKLVNARQECLNALAAHASLHDAAVALGLFEGLAPAAAAWAHQVLGALNAAQNTAAHNALHDALSANQPATVAWEEQDAGVDVQVTPVAGGGVVVTIRSGAGH